jgi:rare lipoprotein A
MKAITFCLSAILLACGPAAAESWTGQAAYYPGRKIGGQKLTAAHLTLPFGTRVKVTNLSNAKSVILLINDRGPYSRRFIIDVSHAAADMLDFRRSGVAPVRIETIAADVPARPKRVEADRTR